MNLRQNWNTGGVWKLSRLFLFSSVNKIVWNRFLILFYFLSYLKKKSNIKNKKWRFLWKRFHKIFCLNFDLNQRICCGCHQSCRFTTFLWPYVTNKTIRINFLLKIFNSRDHKDVRSVTFIIRNVSSASNRFQNKSFNSQQFLTSGYSEEKHFKLKKLEFSGHQTANNWSTGYWLLLHLLFKNIYTFLISSSRLLVERL